MYEFTGVKLTRVHILAASGILILSFAFLPVEELRSVPGIERREALRIIAQRPYAKLPDLVRAGV